MMYNLKISGSEATLETRGWQITPFQILDIQDVRKGWGGKAIGMWSTKNGLEYNWLPASYPTEEAAIQALDVWLLHRASGMVWEPGEWRFRRGGHLWSIRAFIVTTDGPFKGVWGAMARKNDANRQGPEFQFLVPKFSSEKEARDALKELIDLDGAAIG